MIAFLDYLKTNFKNNQSIIDVVGANCKLLIELQDAVTPYLAYNIREDVAVTKDGDAFQLVIAIVAKTMTQVLTIRETVKTVLSSMPKGYYFQYEGSSFLDKEADDEVKIELTYNIT